jgi:hypothetical protein
LFFLAYFVPNATLIMSPERGRFHPGLFYTGAAFMKKPINDPKHWRDRAAAMRALAATMKDPETMAIMCRLADDYDTLADRAAQRQAGTD